MKEKYPLTYNYESSPNAKLYEFLAMNYDISVLATKIYAAKYAKIGLLNLKKLSEPEL